jgi:predicted regulator of Ras-like GTPase activity (Roadblock/LC7/MglB family)
MDAARALERLTEESAQIRAACLLDENGAEVASTLGDAAAAGRFEAAARAFLDEARRASGGRAAPLAQLEAATPDGSVFVVLDGDRAVVAVTRPEPTVGLVFYDLKSCLRAAGTAGDEDGRSRPRARRQAAGESAA